MEPLVISPNDEEEAFSMQLFAMLQSPRQGTYNVTCNGLNSLFSADLNCALPNELSPPATLSSPDYTRQLNSAGLHDPLRVVRHQAGLPSLQLPSAVVGGPGAPMLSPLAPMGSFTNGSSFHFEQLLQDADLQQLPDTLKQPAVGAAWWEGPLPVPTPLTPQQQQQPQEQLQQEQLQQEQLQQEQLQQEQLQQEQLQQEQLQQVRHAPQQQQQQLPTVPAQKHTVRLPPGLHLVAPTPQQHIPPVVVQPSTPPAAAAAGPSALRPHRRQQQQQQGLQHALPADKQQQQRGQKRQLQQQQPAGELRKVARAGSASSPAMSASAAAVAAVGAAADVARADGAAASLASPITPNTPAAGMQAAALAAGADLTAPDGLHGLGSLLWGKVDRFPWWPAVIIPPSHDDPAPEQQQQQPGKPPLFVRFLGTHDTAWLEPSRVSPWPVQLAARSSKTKAAAFVSAVREARAYAAAGALPQVFADAFPEAVLKGQQQQQQQSGLSAQKADSRPAGLSVGEPVCKVMDLHDNCVPIPFHSSVTVPWL